MRAHGDLPPGPRSPATVQGLGFWTRPYASAERLRARFGTPFSTRLPLLPWFVVHSHPDHVKQLFTAPPDVLHPGEGARVLEPVVGLNSVLLLDEDAHMEQRKLLLPSMHGEKMARLVGLIEEVAEREIASWPRDGAIALHPRLQRLTLEIILRAVFGLDEGERLDALRVRLAELLVWGDKPISLVPPRPGTVAYAVGERVGPLRSFVRLRERADALLFELIAERRRDRADRDDILSLVLDARHDDGTPMSDGELRDELMTLLVAGHETTASTLAWVLALIPHEPRVLRELRAEIDSGDGDDYLTATLQETQRRRPVLPNAAPRLVKKPIEVAGFGYEPGVALVASAYLLHHEPEVHPDPYSFRPERFLDDPPGTYTWIPFGGGRRRCLGASFANVEMKIVLRELLSRCDVVAVGDRPEPPRRRNITVTPAGGTRAVLRDRVRAAVAAAA